MLILIQIHGICNEIDSCACDEGYQINSNLTAWNKCEPICNLNGGETGCGNGICIAPETCGCLEGFELNIKGNFTCVPKSEASILEALYG